MRLRAPTPDDSLSMHNHVGAVQQAGQASVSRSDPEAVRTTDNRQPGCRLLSGCTAASVRRQAIALTAAAVRSPIGAVTSASSSHLAPPPIPPPLASYRVGWTLRRAGRRRLHQSIYFRMPPRSLVSGSASPRIGISDRRDYPHRCQRKRAARRTLLRGTAVRVAVQRPHQPNAKRYIGRIRVRVRAPRKCSLRVALGDQAVPSGHVQAPRLRQRASDRLRQLAPRLRQLAPRLRQLAHRLRPVRSSNSRRRDGTLDRRSVASA